MKSKGLIILDRDGVLNEMCLNPEHGIVDSPLHISQVHVFPYVPQVIRQLCDFGYDLVVATNQPSAAKGKTTRSNLEAVHQRVLDEAQSAGGKISHSFICFHTSDEGCRCRKPKTGMLDDAEEMFPGRPTYMVGDGITDIEAGQKKGFKTAFLGPYKTDAMKIFHDKKIKPDYWCKDLKEFSDYLLE